MILVCKPMVCLVDDLTMPILPLPPRNSATRPIDGGMVTTHFWLTRVALEVGPPGQRMEPLRGLVALPGKPKKTPPTRYCAHNPADGWRLVKIL